MTAAECESIGLSANDVGNYGCRDGEVCVHEVCTVGSEVPDAGEGSAGLDASTGSSGRCDPAKDFATFERIPNVHTTYGEQNFILTEDELTGFVFRDEMSVYRATMSKRSMTTDEFPVDSDDPQFSIASHATEISLVRGGRVLYYDSRGLKECERTDLNAAFSSAVVADVTTNTAAFPAGKLIDVTPDGTTLYFLANADGLVYQASSGSKYYSFGALTVASAVAADHAVISRDEHALYYSTAAGIYRATRPDKASTFGAGILIASTTPGDFPTSVTGDDCSLYVIGHHDDNDGVFALHRGQ